MEGLPLVEQRSGVAVVKGWAHSKMCGELQASQCRL